MVGISRNASAAVNAIILTVCLLTNYAAFAQSSLPPLAPEVARNLLGVYAGCKAYWKVMNQCLPGEAVQFEW
jgi:hypothetical protein